MERYDIDGSMQPILGAKGLKLLERISRRKTALVFDYDGTLSPLVFLPSEATMRPQTQKYLNEVAKLYPTALLSGRKLSDVRARAHCRFLAEVVGNHGLEWKDSTDSHRFLSLVKEWRLQLAFAVKAGELRASDIEIEDKKVSFSIHYRRAGNPSRVKREIEALLPRFAGARVLGGKFVFNVLPDVTVNKGTAVLALKKKLLCDHVVFVGDDKTDEDAFALKKKSFLVDVRVGRSASSKARYFLKSQKMIDVLLEKLIDLRK
jgi:trehalose 6-phosphate phosphatase